MILDNKEELEELSHWDNWVIHPIYLDNQYHPVQNRISALYFINTLAWNSHIIPIEHSEKIGDIELSDVVKYFSENEVSTYIYDKKSAINHIEDYETLYDLELLYYLSGDSFNYNDLFSDYYHRWKKFSKINTIIPLAILYDRLDTFYKSLGNDFDNLTKHREKKNKPIYKNYDSVITTLNQIEKNGLYKDGELVYTQYHIYTKTGRPSNAFGGTNYAALNKSDDTRTHYTNRFEGGALYLYDYTAFHPTILSNYLKIGRPEGISMHDYLGQIYFQTDELSEEQYNESKKKTFFYLYTTEELHDDVKDIEFFQKVAELKREIGEMDYITTPLYKRKMYVEGLEPSKKFNYFLQCFETEINYVKMAKINEYLDNFKAESKLVLYTYDSFLIDYSPNDKEIILPTIQKILESGKFKTTVHCGKNYKDMQKVSLG